MAAMASASASTESNGRSGEARSATHGDRSYTPPSASTNAASSASFSVSIVSSLIAW